jgi:lysophosphatidic acid acyltransferase/lysophosphatidylinositol acyltransferase
VEWHAGFTIEIRADSQDTLDRIGKESAIVLANHSSDIDWLLGWVVAHKVNILGVSPP